MLVHPEKRAILVRQGLRPGPGQLLVLFGSLAGLAQTVQLLATPVGSAGLLAIDQAFKRIIDDETVTQGIPWATPYEELENKRKVKVPVKVKSIRGKFNVPRQRFHVRSKTEYLWAGLQFHD